MKALIFLILLSLLFVRAQGQDILSDSGVFLLHKFEQHIGQETYKIYKAKDRRENDAKKYIIDFKFVDRGSPVPLKASLKVLNNYQPLELFVKGNTSRFSMIDDSIQFKSDQVLLNVSGKKSTLTTQEGEGFPITGYAPATIQQVLIQYWYARKQPAVIKTLPFGSVQVKMTGVDKLVLKGKPITLNRFIISGLIWGNEQVWTDNTGKLICILTIDAEGDKTEMVRTQYESLLPELIRRAAGYGMESFAKRNNKLNADAGVLAITGGEIIDVENGKAVPNTGILIENGIITQMGSRISIPKGAQVINAEGKCIIPGLWDMHAHFEQTEWGPAYLAAGVTTVRDCGNELGFITGVKQAIDDGYGIGPQILMAGIIDGKGPMALGIIQADTKEEAIKAVQTYKSKGFVQIKIYGSAKPAIVKAICEEAHKLGLTVTGHIPDGMLLQAGVDSGMNMVNHMQYVFRIMKANKDRSVNFEDSVSIAAIKFIKDNKTVIDPTLGVYELAFRNVKEDITKMEPAFHTLPLVLQTQFRTYGVDSSEAERLAPRLKSMKSILKKLYDAGVPIVAGTDMGFPGFSLARELEIYVEASLSPGQALRTATIIPAQVMGLAQKTGSVKIGKNADLVIIDGNPLTNISNVRQVKVVVKGGKVYDPVTLHKMVGFNVAAN